ncbi:B3 domain-containing transcription factor VRN1 [Euphorbia peplus]|nr:B3 domain-containing transcription factor VRN1 [Euphorbia peplus]
MTQYADTGKVFFSIILDKKKLSLPLKFLKKFGDELLSVANIMVPNGHVWKVELRKEKDETIMFGAGLNDMFKYYSIRVGHFLIFKYKGMSCFSVRILDKTTCEIEYRFHVPRVKEKHTIKDIKEEESVEILGSDVSPSSSKEQYKRKRSTSAHRDLPTRRSDAPSAHDRKGKRKVDMNFLNQAFKRRKPQAKFGGIRMTERIEGKPEIHMGRHFDATLSRMPQESKAAVELARNTNPKNPSFLIIIVKNAIRGIRMFVPSGFACRYLKGVDNEIKIEDRDGNEWMIDTNFLWKGGSLRLQNGWSEFYGENCLEEGDVCLFELIQIMPNIVLKVSIFHI